MSGSQPADSRLYREVADDLRRFLAPEVVEASPAALAKELQRLVGHGLTIAKQQESPQLRSVGGVPSGQPTGPKSRESMESAIQKGIDSIQSERYVKHLHQTLSAKKVQAILEMLLLPKGDEYAFNRRKTALKVIGRHDGRSVISQSAIDWWRRAGDGPEYDLMYILAEALLSPPSETNTGAIQYEEATYHIGKYGWLLKSEHRIQFTAVVDGFEYLRVFTSPRPIWDLENGVMKPAMVVHASGVEPIYTDSALGFHFEPMQRGESRTIAWDVLAYESRSESTGYGFHSGRDDDCPIFAYFSPVERLTIKLRAPVEWHGEQVSVYSCRSNENRYEAVRKGRKVRVTVREGQKIAEYQFVNLKSGRRYGMHWRLGSDDTALPSDFTEH